MTPEVTDRISSWMWDHSTGIHGGLFPTLYQFTIYHQFRLDGIKDSSSSWRHRGGKEPQEEKKIDYSVCSNNPYNYLHS